MINFKNPSVRIAALITIFPLITLFLYGALSHLFFIDAQQKIIKQDIKKTKNTMMDIEQHNLREKVENLTLFIKYHNNKNIEQSKSKTREVIYFSANIANNLYLNNKDSINEASLKKIIITALNNINFGNNIDYLFLQDLSGNTLIHRDEALVNTNTINIKDVNGKYIIKEFNKIINDQKEGFANYYWYKTPNNKDSVYSKITFVKRLDAYDWYIGAGEKIETISNTTREEILEYVTSNATFKNGYFFITDSKNNIILKPENSDMSDLEQFRMDGFFTGEHHTAYTLYIAQFDWYVTAVKELSVIQQNISLKKKENSKAIKEELKTNIYLIALSWVISLILSLYLSLLIYRILKKYKTKLSDINNKLIFQSRQATIGELLPMIAHQWRQPINRIASTLALIRFHLLEERIDHKQIDDQCHSIEKNIEFMSETIDDFRTFYHPNETKTKENLKELICKSLVFLEEKTHKKNIKTTITLDDVIFEVYGNEFMQVVINLLDNALDAVPSEDGRILIDLHKNRAGEIILLVEDNGLGIDEPSLQKIFDPYFSTKKGSMGLGLYMCKMIVEKHLEGRISAEKLSSGTRFCITL